MVWLMHYNPDKCRSGVFFGLKTFEDIVYQTINIMFDCHQPYDSYDIHSLTNVGVNIFNVDLTKHDQDFFDHIKDAMERSRNMPEMIPSAYYKPVSLSVTMSANDAIDVDERVDIIILKDVITLAQLYEFRKINEKFFSIPILFWPPTLEIEDLNELIKSSAGIVLDPSLSNMFSGFRHILADCKEAHKPVFYMNPTVIEDYYQETANDRQLLPQVCDIVKYRLDGMILLDRGGRPPIELLQALIRATDIIERNFEVTVADYFKMSFPLKLPVLQPFSVAIAASLAALQSQAAAILVFTRSGASAKLASCTMPPCRLIAITRHEKTARRLHLYRKVMPLHYRKERANSWQEERLARVAFGTQFGLDTGLFNFGAKLVVLAPVEEGDFYCNGFQIATIANIINDFKCGQKFNMVWKCDSCFESHSSQAQSYQT